MRRILRIAYVHPDIIELYAQDKIGFDQLKAFGATDNQALQKQILDQLGPDPAVWRIREALGLDNRRQQQMIQIIGGDAYVAAGGKFTADLFSDGGGSIDNPELLVKLFDEHCAAFAAAQEPPSGRTSLRTAPPKRFRKNSARHF